MNEKNELNCHIAELQAQLDQKVKDYDELLADKETMQLEMQNEKGETEGELLAKMKKERAKY